jgi:AraC family transcriptional regulator
MEPEFVQRPAFTLVGIKYRGKNEQGEIPQLWNAFMDSMKDIPRIVNPQVCYGAQNNFNEATGEFDYLAAYEVPEDSQPPAGMETWPVTAGHYAVFRTTLPDIMQTYEYIYGTWMPQSGYQRASGVEFELYDDTFNSQDPTSTLSLYVPLTK